MLPRIVVTKEDGRMETPSPKLPIRKRESFGSSLPDVNNDEGESNNAAPQTELSNKQVKTEFPIFKGFGQKSFSVVMQSS